MNLNHKVLPVALVAALLGGSVGAFVMRSSKSAPSPADTAATTNRLTPVAPAHETADANTLAANNEAANNEQAALNTDNLTNEEREAYRAGFVDGARTAGSTATQTRTVNEYRNATAPARVVYRNTGRARTASRASANRVYYDYEQPRQRSFWQKHRDKLTVAMGSGGGALIGGLIGGKKGAAIGALAGAGGSALYTYKIRKRNRRY